MVIETTNLKECIGECRYLCGSTPDSEDCYPLFISQYKIDLRNHVNEIPVDITEELLAIHGIVTSATSIPLDVPNDVDIFLIVKDATTDFDSYIIPIEDIETLQKLVEMIVLYEFEEEEEVEDDIIELMGNIEQQNIGDLYVVYGTQVALAYTCDSTATPYNVVDQWKFVFNTIKEKQNG